MSDDLDSFEAEGIQAFNRLTGAVQGLDGRLTVLDAGLGAKVTNAQHAATKAVAAAERAEAVANAVREAVLAGARSSTAWAVCIVTAGVLVAGGLGYFLGERAGQATGEAAGYQDARDEKAAASWANTPSGRMALALDQNGSLAMVAECSGKGWHTETQHGRRYCFGGPAPDGQTYGWTLP